MLSCNEQCLCCNDYHEREMIDKDDFCLCNIRENAENLTKEYFKYELFPNKIANTKVA